MMWPIEGNNRPWNKQVVINQKPLGCWYFVKFCNKSNEKGQQKNGLPHVIGTLIISINQL